jgi:Amt family ammonium transporter
MILGQREQDVTVRSEHTELMTFIGGALLWVGWFGFNAGSALSAGGTAGMAFLVTHICAATCSFAWMLVEWIHKGKPTVTGIVSGAITGLVVMSPAAGYVDQTAGFCMGLFAAPVCYALIVGKNMLGLDQKPNASAYPDAFGVQAIGGIVGGFLTGLFANPAVYNASGAFYKNGDQLGWQILAMLIVIGYAAVVTALIMLILKFTIGINEQALPQKLPVAEEHPLQPAMQVMPMPMATMAPSPMMMMHQPFQPAYHPGFSMGTA